jgi:hypothetical protein
MFGPSTINDQPSTVMMIGQLPSLAPGELERWLASAVAVGGVVLLGMKLVPRRLDGQFVTKDEFRQFRTAVEHDLGGLRDRIDSRHLDVIKSIDDLKVSLLADAERRGENLHKRLTAVESGVAVLHERTKRVES